MCLQTTPSLTLLGGQHLTTALWPGILSCTSPRAGESFTAVHSDSEQSHLTSPLSRLTLSPSSTVTSPSPSQSVTSPSPLFTSHTVTRHRHSELLKVIFTVAAHVGLKDPAGLLHLGSHGDSESVLAVELEA